MAKLLVSTILDYFWSSTLSVSTADTPYLLAILRSQERLRHSVLCARSGCCRTSAWLLPQIGKMATK